MTTKKRGRPSGKKTEDCDIICEMPASCTKCDSTDLKVISGTRRELDSSGVHQGQIYNKVILHYVRCGDCDQRLGRRRFVFDKAK